MPRRIIGPEILGSTTVFTASGNYAAVNDAAVVVKKTVGGATVVTLPSSLIVGQKFQVKDGKGDAATNNITVNPDGVTATTIDGAASVVLNTNYASALFLWNGTEWNVLSINSSASGGNLTVGGYLFESNMDGIVAHAGGGQGSATAMTAELNRIVTVATAGDSVLLPPSKPGLTIIVENHGANYCQVFGAGTDTIDDVATATGVSQMQGSVTIYSCYTAGAWYSNGIGTGYNGSLPTVSFINGLTAHAGGGQGSALALTNCINRVTTVASANDSVVLPASAGGLQITVYNAAAANSLNVFPASGDSINALSANTAFAVAAGKNATFGCAGVGVPWHAILSA